MKIAVFGIGSAAKDFLSIVPSDVEIVGLFDNDSAKHGRQVDGRMVLPPEEIADCGADYIVIAARDVDGIRQQLIDREISFDRIVAFYPSYSATLASEANRDIALLNKIGVPIAPIGLATMYLDRTAAVERVDSGEGEAADFVRNKAFALAARQIRDRDVQGAVAELGVYRGYQAQLINRLFPDRTLYLFDTFTGFAAQDLGAERDNGLSGAVTGDFENTSVDLVLGKLPHREQARVMQGFFPDTAAGLEETFAFVSLDVDLYDPIRAGLHWFYERLSAGGFIFVHDYNNVRYLGVRKAVDEFVEERGASFVPLPDFAGSVVIAK
ncbi:TylF/MycF/NovP-related O-methyltransferase [Sphingomonas sp. NFR04]|uniref:TylF/MycF/NovP-related O-methyltransferase n=1 Tax=Sphingomonas sp. NFR04 TaxID=1566283 RepID=UPI0015870E89|nr:TylF/MycF/NovP-related O-methyltransferase [Sphingomonas sp. NFR04]